MLTDGPFLNLALVHIYQVLSDQYSGGEERVICCVERTGRCSAQRVTDHISSSGFAFQPFSENGQHGATDAHKLDSGFHIWGRPTCNLTRPLPKPHFEPGTVSGLMLRLVIHAAGKGSDLDAWETFSLPHMERLPGCSIPLSKHFTHAQIA